MSVKLNLDSFRAMVGANNYGEVRLSENGGLEKINNHFAQRKLGIGKATTTAYENRAIRQALAQSVEGKVSLETLGKIRSMLGLRANDMTVVSTPLSRRTIAAVLAEVDACRAQKFAGDVSAQRFAQNDKDVLRTVINNHNASAPKGARIKLNDAELDILLKRHGVDFQDAVAGRAGDVQDVVLGKLKDILAHEDVREGERRFSGTAAARPSFDGMRTVGATPARQQLIETFAFDEDAFQDNDALRANDRTAIRDQLFTKGFAPKDFHLADFGKLSNLGGTLEAELARKPSLPLLEDGAFTLFGEALFKDRCSSYGGNMTRNAFGSLSLTGANGEKTAFEFQSDNTNAGGASDATQANKDTLRNFMLSVARQCPKMDARQFMATFYVFNQTVYNAPKLLGADGMRVADVNVSVDGDNVKVSMNWVPTGEGAAENAVPLRLDYDVLPNGFCKVNHFGPNP